MQPDEDGVGGNTSAQEGARKAIDAAAAAAEKRGDDDTANLLRMLARFDPDIITRVVAHQSQVAATGRTKAAKVEEIEFEARKARFFELVFLTHGVPHALNVDVPVLRRPPRKLAVKILFRDIDRYDAADIDFTVTDAANPVPHASSHHLAQGDEIAIDAANTITARIEAVRHQVFSHSFVLISLRMVRAPDDIVPSDPYEPRSPVQASAGVGVEETSRPR